VTRVHTSSFLQQNQKCHLNTLATGYGDFRVCLRVDGRGDWFCFVSFCCYTPIIYHWRKFVGVLELICLSKKYFFYQTVIELRFFIEFEQNQYGWAGDKTCS